MYKRPWPIRCCLSLLLLAAIVPPAMAQRSAGAAVVAGVSASPDQFYVGGNVMAGKIEKDFWFRPGVEVGFGHSTTLVGLNGEFVYLMDLRKSPWTAYFGGGPVLNITTIHRNSPAKNSSDVGPGFNFLAGLRKSHGIFGEIKVGAMDSPAFKFGVGYTFK